MAEGADPLEATVLLVGQGVLPEALAKRLGVDGLELERATVDRAAQVAQVAVPDLVLLAGDAASDGGKRVLARMTERTAGDLPTLVILRSVASRAGWRAVAEERRCPRAGRRTRRVRAADPRRRGGARDEGAQRPLAAASRGWDRGCGAPRGRQRPPHEDADARRQAARTAEAQHGRWPGAPAVARLVGGGAAAGRTESAEDRTAAAQGRAEGAEPREKKPEAWRQFAATVLDSSPPPARAEATSPSPVLDPDPAPVAVTVPDLAPVPVPVALPVPDPAPVPFRSRVPVPRPKPLPILLPNPASLAPAPARTGALFADEIDVSVSEEVLLEADTPVAWSTAVEEAPAAQPKAAEEPELECGASVRDPQAAGSRGSCRRLARCWCSVSVLPGSRRDPARAPAPAAMTGSVVTANAREIAAPAPSSPAKPQPAVARGAAKSAPVPAPRPSACTASAYSRPLRRRVRRSSTAMTPTRRQEQAPARAPREARSREPFRERRP